MAGITGLGTTFNLPNYVGELFGLTPEDTPLLDAIGGLTGGEEATDTRFGWQTYDLRDPAQNVKTEGADAPTPQERVRGMAYNVVEIHQEAVAISYTKQAAIGQLGGQGAAPVGVPTGGRNPVVNEMSWQVEQTLKEIARDVEWAFINGTFQEPTDNTTERKMRGLLQAITTNVTSGRATGVALQTSAAADDIIDAAAHGLAIGDQVQFSALTGGAGLTVGTTYYVIADTFAAGTFKVSATAGGAAINFTTDITAGTVHKLRRVTDEILLDAMQLAFDNGGIQEGETRTAIMGSTIKRHLTKALITDKGYKEESRNVGGVTLTSIETDFGRLNLMLNRYMPKDQLVVVSLEQLAPVLLPIPDPDGGLKGFLFEEELAKTGASFRKQIYGEIGLKYGSQIHHAKIQHLATV